MLNQTTIMAIQTLVYIGRQRRPGPIPPGEIAEQLGASPAYLAKIHTQLAKANILRSYRGTRGGVMLEQHPSSITLLQVVEACQGVILGDYCQKHDKIEEVCAFHAAMHELQAGLVSTLSKWTLADLLKKPFPAESLRGQVNCRMECACEGEKKGVHAEA
jgi:Rrf2 family protein